MTTQIEIPVEVDYATYQWLMAKYSDDQQRDERGRWSQVAGAGTKPNNPKAHLPGRVKIERTTERAFSGKAVPTSIKLNNKETDKITEAVVIQHLRAQGFKDAEVAATVKGYRGNNYAVDVFADHQAIELKGGNVSNTPGAQQWRVKYGEESKEFNAWKQTVSSDRVYEVREGMAAKCLKDKETARKWFQSYTGHKVSSVTYTAIINPDKRVVDLFRFGGYHLRIGWKSQDAKGAYVKSYKY